jgi:pimeloyl-ACP methyl ester carboxylesterase
MAKLPQPWWEHLDPEFHARTEGFDLDLADQTKVAASVWLDTTIRTGAAVAVGTLAVPVGYNPVRLARDFARESLYTTAALARDPSLFFEAPPRFVSVRIREARLPLFSPASGVCEELTFESRYVPANPLLRDTFAAYRANRIARARYWRHHAGPRPTVVAIHGFYADNYWLNERFFDIRGLYELGCDVVLFTLPFHGTRQERGSFFSGHGFFAGGPAHINEAFGQAVHDVRTIMNYLEDARGVERLGVTGLSLGGYTAALLAAIEPRLCFSLPTVPVATIPDLLLEWPPVSAIMRFIFAHTDIALVDARRIMAVHCPLTYEPLLDQERLMVIGGIGDRLAPPKHSRLLWEHWRRCRLHWFPGSHVVHLDKADYVFEIERFLRDIDFLGKP